MAERRPGELRCPAMCNDKTKELRENERSRNAPHGSRTDVASDMHTHVLHRGGKDGFGKHGEDSVEFRAQLHYMYIRLFCCILLSPRRRDPRLE